VCATHDAVVIEHADAKLELGGDETVPDAAASSA
jgi:hypothetical protein